MTADPMISPKPVMTVETEVSSFDQTSAMLTAWVIVLGTLVGALLMIWLSTVVKDRMIVTTSIPLEEIPIGDGPPPLGIGDDWHPPGVEDFPEVDIPQLATAIDAVGPDKTELFLVKLALMNANALADPAQFQAHIDAALKDL